MHQIIQDGVWNIPLDIRNLYPIVVVEMENVHILDSDHDEFIWERSDNGNITVKIALEHYRETGPVLTQGWQSDRTGHPIHGGTKIVES